MTAKQQPAATDQTYASPGAISVDQVEDRLRRWVTRVDPSASLSLGPPTDGASGFGAALQLVELTRHPPTRGPLRPPVRLELCYSVTTWSESPGHADRLLVELALDAATQTDLEVDLHPRPAEFWTALRVAPRPSFTILVPVSRARPSRVATRVLYPLVVLSPAHHMAVAGVVCGPHDTPIANASVELVGLDRATITDRFGRFAFGTVPRTPVGVRLRVRAKGVELEVPVRDNVAGASELSINLEL